MAGTDPQLAIHIAEDRSSVSLSFISANGGSGPATLDFDQLTSIIEGLGLARQHMASGRPTPPLEGQPVRAVFDVSWYVAPDLHLGGSALLFQHPGFGPLAFVMPPEQSLEIARLLTAHSRLASRGSMAAN